MTKKRNDKKTPALEPFLEGVFVCNDKRLKPFIEIFVQEPENVAQQDLGILLGVFEITDFSEDSSYIVNYLISVIKKEYFWRPRRAAIESLEAALHKANLALSKLAEHGNVKWIGKLNALVAIIEKGSLHLSQAGTSSAFLLRSKSLTDVSEGLVVEELEPHPLKTFVNISSGRLEDGDKIIITTGGIFNVFSLEEIKKSALRFPGEKFIQFLKTALGNELEKAAVLVADIKEKEEAVTAAPNVEQKEVNAFSSAAFARNFSSAKADKDLKKELEQAKEKTSREKNGHIYIKGAESSLPRRDRVAEFFSAAKKKLRLAGKKSLILIKKISGASVQKIKSIFLPRPRPNTFLNKKKQENKIPPEAARDSETAAPVAFPKIGTAKLTFLPVFIKSFPLKAGNLWKKIRNSALPPIHQILPNFLRIRDAAVKMDYQKRLYVALIIIAVIIVPFLALKLQNYVRQKNDKPLADAPVAMPLEQDKNVVRMENLNPVYSGENILAAVNLNGKTFGIAHTQIIDLQNGGAFAIPEDFGQAKLAAGMDDLNLIFLINLENKALAWSPASKKFQTNNIAIPENSDVTAAGTYLTYLYLLDSKNNQIYRYPWATGGFGEKTNWLKDSVDLSQATGMALSENIFVTDGNNLWKLFKGKKQDFALESSATPTAPHKVYARSGNQNIYVLDKQNSRIIKLDLNGNIVLQYFTYQIGNATDFTVDEQNNTAYISTSGNIYSFALN